ncbi:DExH-box ATP-dependent RNA helicase DExH5, mitochondrial [Linum grandiflorum]
MLSLLAFNPFSLRFPLSAPPPPKPSAFPMKDRPPSPYGAVYVPPHQRLRSVIVSPTFNSSASSHLLESGTTDSRCAALSRSKASSCPSPTEHQQRNGGAAEVSNKNPIPKFVSACIDAVSEDGSDHDMESLPVHPSGAYMSGSIEEWRWKFTMLLRDKEKKEVVSREKKDRRDFEQLAALASKMGLYSRTYVKVVVFSKVPLPNYRFDLDDKRPQREVSLPLGLLKRVHAYLGDYAFQKSKIKECCRDMSRSNSSGSLGADEGLFELPESLASSKIVMEKALRWRSQHLYEKQLSWQESPEGREMMEFRKTLPAYKEKNAILTAVAKNQVVIISGETGCGKTTQIPQFIMESEIDVARGAACSIICTQPRRISAISVSERVATERGEKLGESVGYKVRLEGIKGRETHLLFCTTGILLRRLLVDRSLKGVTHVIVDEIHERGMNEDFLLIVLKDLLPRRPDLRLVLMSATLDAELFSSYFDRAPILRIPGFTFPVKTHFLENILEMTGYRLTPYNQIDDYGQERAWKLNKQGPKRRKSQIASAVEDALRTADFRKYRKETQDSLSLWNPDCIGFNLIEYLLSYICENERPGAILVFLTGLDDISSLKDKLQTHTILGDPRRVLLLTCHGSMASSEQRLIFDVPPYGVRKIVLATNIAETSITIDDVVYVIECGKAKETSYDALNNTPCLLPSWISKVSAQQRRGRAGRVQPGECYHLYPRCVYDAFAEYQLPEILRTPLQSLCLQIKSLKLGSISEFLSRALQSPELLAVEKAIEYLKVIGALDKNEDLTVLGQYLTRLPVEPKLGKMLVLGAIFNCLDPISTIVAGLSVRDPFLTPLDKKDLAEAAKAQFSRDYSDHMALVRAFNGWKDAERNFAGYDYCWKNFLSVQSMKAIDSLRKEFYSLIRDTGLIDGNTNSNGWSHEEHLVRAVICYGLYPGVCSVVNNEKSFSLKTMEDGQVLLYSNSVNAQNSSIPYPWLVFNEKVKVNAVFLRDSTAVSDSMLLLFGGTITKGNADGHLKMLGGYLEFFMKPTMAEMYTNLKRELDELIQMKLLNPKTSLKPHEELFSAVRLLLCEDRSDGRFVFGHQLLKPTKPPVMASTTRNPNLASGADNGPGGDNPKSQLQTLLTRAGYSPPVYKTKQLKNNQFRSTVEFNSMEVMGNPYANKKSAEKDAAAEALIWLMGGSQTGRDYIDRMSILQKRSKKNHF